METGGGSHFEKNKKQTIFRSSYKKTQNNDGNIHK